MTHRVATSCNVGRTASAASAATPNPVPDVPEGLDEKEKHGSVPPTREQLHRCLQAAAIPYIGFGFLDNFLMIVFGDFIDSTLCVALNFSTMAAAAIGNTLSDGAGIWSGQWLEARAKSLGFEEPKLSEEQEEMGVTVRWRNVGQFVGITVGCILGCCPLLWMDPEAAIKQRREKEREEAFEIVVSKVQELLQAEAVSLLLLNKERDELIASHQTTNLPEHFHWKLDEGFIGHVVSTGHFINVADIKDEAQYNPEIHDNFLKTGIKVQSILCMPIFRGGEVHGVVSVVNKKKNHGAFTQKDEDLLSAICSHVSVALIDDKQTFKEVIEQCEKSMQTTGSPEFTSAASQRMATLFVPALEGLRTVLGAEATVLMLLDRQSQELFSEVIDGPLPHHTAPVGVGAAGEAVQVGHYMNVPQTETTGSELAVPLFDTSRKCLGAIKCVNKQGSSAFNTEDVEFVTQVAHYMGMLLEGPDAGLRRVLASTRQKMQTKAAMQAADAKGTIVCNLVKATSLPSASKRKVIDPYVTFSIARSNPLQQEPGVEQRVMRVRNKDRKAAIRRFAKSGTILEDPNPSWNESIALAFPKKFEGVPEEELWVHVLLWDYDSLRNDELVAHAAFSLSEIRAGKLKEVAAHGLRPLPGTGQASSEAPVLGPDKQIATLWVSFDP